MCCTVQDQISVIRPAVQILRFRIQGCGHAKISPGKPDPHGARTRTVLLARSFPPIRNSTPTNPLHRRPLGGWTHSASLTPRAVVPPPSFFFKLSGLARIPCVLPPPRYPLFNHSALTKPDQSLLAGLSLLSLNGVIRSAIPERVSDIDKFGYHIPFQVKTNCFCAVGLTAFTSCLRYQPFGFETRHGPRLCLVFIRGFITLSRQLRARNTRRKLSGTAPRSIRAVILKPTACLASFRSAHQTQYRKRPTRFYRDKLVSYKLTSA